MSIIMKYMVGGKVNVNEFNSFEKLLPVMAHVQDEKYPYYVMQDGKAIFKYNLQYVEKQAKPAEVYTLRIKYPDETKSEDYTDLVSLAAATMAANDAEFPWYVVDNAGNIIRKGNLDKLPSKNTTPAPKAGVEEAEEVEDASDIDIDTIVDEASNAIDDIDVIGDTEEHIPEQPVKEVANLDLIEDAAFLDQDADGLFHIIRVDDRILTGYMDLRYATKEKAVKHFNELNKAHIAMITFSLPDNSDNCDKSYVPVRSFNFDKANKDHALNAIFHVFSLREAWTHCVIGLSDELEKMLDSFLESFRPEDGCFFECEPFEIHVDGKSYFIKDEYVRNDIYYIEMCGRTEKEEWRYLYNSKEAAVDFGHGTGRK